MLPMTTGRTDQFPAGHLISGRPVTNGTAIHRSLIPAILFCLLVLGQINPAHGTTDTYTSAPIRYFQTDLRYQYRIDLLKLALDHTLESHGPYKIAPTTESITQARGIDLLERKEGVDVAFLPTTKERELKLRAIKIPILRGILGYRVLLIHRDDQAKFASIYSLDELREHFRGGFGSQWADMAILKQNQLKVVGIAQYESLFSMLEVKRFDYFPRGINEAWKEIELQHASYPHLMVEENLALYYPYPVYFFVHKNNLYLADRINLGLQMALSDGSFKALFMAYHQDFIEQAKLTGRRMFILSNPTLPEDTDSPDTQWWLKP